MINTIQLGDCYELIKKIPDKSIDLVYIDPPYDFMSKHYSYGTTYSGAGTFGKMNRTYHSELENSSIINGINTKEILNELCRVMKHIYIYMV
jgi:site-specific DNA-methyltransferase (adenine-specific)/modification methylase